MGSMNYQRRFTPTAPDKGSFPLDHDGECKVPMLRYMVCLERSGHDGGQCRQLSREYLRCRMERQLMAVEDWDSLGFGDLASSSSSESQQPAKS